MSNADFWADDDQNVCLKGIGKHEINSIPIVTEGGITKNITGEIIIEIHQRTCYSKGYTTHSSVQIEYFKNFVDDKSIKVSGKQHVLTNENYTVLVAMKMGFLMLLCVPVPINNY